MFVLRRFFCRHGAGQTSTCPHIRFEVCWSVSSSAFPLLSLGCLVSWRGWSAKSDWHTWFDGKCSFGCTSLHSALLKHEMLPWHCDGVIFWKEFFGPTCLLLFSFIKACRTLFTVHSLNAAVYAGGIRTEETEVKHKWKLTALSLCYHSTLSDAPGLRWNIFFSSHWVIFMAACFVVWSTCFLIWWGTFFSLFGESGKTSASQSCVCFYFLYCFIQVPLLQHVMVIAT